MAQLTERQRFWIFSRQYWWLSILLALVLLGISFKDIIYGLIKTPDAFTQVTGASPFWRAIIEDSLTDSLGAKIEHVLPFVLIAGGGALLLYSVIFGYLRTYRALTMNSTYLNTKHRPAINVALSNIAIRSLFINVPILFWTVFLFIGLPKLVVLPITAIALGNMKMVALNAIIMILVTVAVVHVGIVLTRLSARFIIRAE